MNEIAAWLGIAPPPPNLNTPYGTHISRRVSAFLKNDKCRPWCGCGWEGRERNDTDANLFKAAQDCRTHRASGRCKLA